MGPNFMGPRISFMNSFLGNMTITVVTRKRWRNYNIQIMFTYHPHTRGTKSLVSEKHIRHRPCCCIAKSVTKSTDFMRSNHDK